MGHPRSQKRLADWLGQAADPGQFVRNRRPPARDRAGRNAAMLAPRRVGTHAGKDPPETAGGPHATYNLVQMLAVLRNFTRLWVLVEGKADLPDSRTICPASVASSTATT